MSSEITPSTARNRYWRPTAPACQIFQVLYVRPSVVWTMESSILRRRPVKPSLDDLSIVQGGYRQWFLALSTPGHGRSFWTNWRCINFCYSINANIKVNYYPILWISRIFLSEYPIVMTSFKIFYVCGSNLPPLILYVLI